jgi:hypothetical protein
LGWSHQGTPDGVFVFMKSRDSMVLYRSFYDAIKLLPDDIQLEIFRAIFEFGLDGIDPELSISAKPFWLLIKPNLQANRTKWESGSKAKRKQSGSKTEAKPKQTRSKAQANVDVDVDVDDNVNENEKKKKQGFDFSLYGNFSKLIERWANYRKSEKKAIKSQDSLDTFSKRLIKLSNGDYELAEAIIEQAIANGWQGIFELNESKKNTEPPAQAIQNYYPPKPEHDPILLRQEVHSNYEDYVRHCLKVGHQPEKPKYPELVPADFDHIAFINQIKSNL